MKKVELITILILLAIGCSFAGWEWQNPKPQGNALRDVHVFDSNHVIAVGNCGTVIRTSDGGYNWDIQQISDPEFEITSVCFVDEDLGWLIGNGGMWTSLLYKTDDGGINWYLEEIIEDKLMKTIFFSDLLNGWVVGEPDSIYHTTDGGETWETHFYGLDMFIEDIFFINDNIGWIVAGEETGYAIAKTINGGETWVVQDSGGSKCYRTVHFINPYEGWVAAGSMDSLWYYNSDIKHTTDGGETWEYQLFEEPDMVLYSIILTTDGKGCVAGFEGAIMVTSDYGDTWEERVIDFGSRWGSWYVYNYKTFFAVDIAGESDYNGFAVGQSGNIARTTDSGLTWNLISESFIQSFNSVHFHNSQKGLVVGNSGLIVSTSDGGNTWNRQISGTDGNIASMSFVDSLNGWASCRTGTYPYYITEILKTTDGGFTWAVVGSLDANIKKLCYVNMANGWALDYYDVYHTDDAGTTWVNVDVGVDTHFYSIQFVDEDHGWIVGGGNSSSSRGIILITIDGGATWFEPPLSYGCHTLFSVYFINRLIGWAVSWRGEIIHTTDGGLTWSWQATESDGYIGLKSVKFIDEYNGWACGYQGIIIKTNTGGVFWKRDTTLTDNDLVSIEITDSNNCWAVGEWGTILHFNDPGTLIDNNRTYIKGFAISISPNPFNSACRISSPVDATVEIFDVLGQSIDKLPGGDQIWKPEASVGSGVYLVRAKVGDKDITKRVVYLK